MAITKAETEKLLAMVAGTQSDTMDCDGCFNHLAELVELELTGREIPDALECVRKHIDQCPCCNDEHNALLEALRTLEGE